MSLNLQVVGVTDYVRRHKVGTDRAEVIQRFADHPLNARGFQLQIACGEVVRSAIAGNIIQSVGFRHVAGFLSNDDQEFRFVVELV